MQRCQHVYNAIEATLERQEIGGDGFFDGLDVVIEKRIVARFWGYRRVTDGQHRGVVRCDLAIRESFVQENISMVCGITSMPLPLYQPVVRMSMSLGHSPGR